MQEYIQQFADNHIDFAILSDLTDEDLEKIGTSLGHRRKLLHAIGDLKGVRKSAPATGVPIMSPVAARAESG